MDILVNALLFLTALASMEVVAILSHKYVMHGFMWTWHESHHRPRTGMFEKNDLFAVVFAMPSIAMIWVGVNVWPPGLWIGLGIAGYGLVYFLFHDVLVHKRIPHSYRPKKGYMQRVLHAHRLHHAVDTREDCVSFGFIYAPSARKLRAQMKEIEARTGRLPQFAQSTVS